MVRFKNRYMVTQIDTTKQKKRKRNHQTDEGEQLNLRKQLFSSIKSQVRANYGDFGMALMLDSLQVKFVYHPLGIAVIRCERKDLEKVKDIVEIKLDKGYKVLHIAGSPRQCVKGAWKVFNQLQDGECSDDMKGEFRRLVDGLSL